MGIGGGGGGDGNSAPSFSKANQEKSCCKFGCFLVLRACRGRLRGRVGCCHHLSGIAQVERPSGRAAEVLDMAHSSEKENVYNGYAV